MIEPVNPMDRRPEAPGKNGEIDLMSQIPFLLSGQVMKEFDARGG